MWTSYHRKGSYFSQFKAHPLALPTAFRGGCNLLDWKLTRHSFREGDEWIVFVTIFGDARAFARAGDGSEGLAYVEHEARETCRKVIPAHATLQEILTALREVLLEEVARRSGTHSSSHLLRKVLGMSLHPDPIIRW